jgi:uncharacterized protein YukJ
MQIQAYLYSNIVEVQIWDPTIFSPRNRVVYSRPITVYQGIDNPLQIVIKNQDQKPVNMTGYTVQLNIEDPVNEVTAYSLAVNFTDITKGTGTVTVDTSTVNSLDQRIYKLTLKKVLTADNSETPLYIDDNFGVPLDLEVKPAYYSTTEPAPALNEVVIDSGLLP